MSYILDALRQVERERQHRQQPLLPVASPQPLLRRGWIGLILLGLLLNAALLAIILNRPHPPPILVTPEPVLPVVPQATPPRRQATRPAPKPTPVAPQVSRKKPVEPVTATSAPVRSPAVQSSEPTAMPPVLDVLPGNARRNIPALKLDVHSHSGEAGQRFVVINGRRYREGERLEEGPVLEAVTINGATLRQGRQRFQLPVR